MGLQLKGDNDNNIGNKDKVMDDLYDEPKVVYNSSMADLQGQQKQGSPIVGAIGKTLIAFVVCAILIFGGKYIVSIVMPEGKDITPLLTKRADVIATELGVTFTDNPTWAANVREYSESVPSVKGTDGIGVVNMDGRQIGVHIETKDYTMFGVRIGDGEKHMYNNTTYPFENFSSILNTMSDKATVYIYYNTSRNDCIFFLINNTTNRIESMTYYYDYKEVSEELTSL